MEILEKLQIAEKAIDMIRQKTQRPVCRLQLSEEPTSHFNSHMGGIPYCPHNQQYPVTSN